MRVLENGVFKKWFVVSEKETNTLYVKMFGTEKECKDMQSLITEFCNKS